MRWALAAGGVRLCSAGAGTHCPVREEGRVSQGLSRRGLRLPGGNLGSPPLLPCVSSPSTSLNVTKPLSHLLGYCSHLLFPFIFTFRYSPKDRLARIDYVALWGCPEEKHLKCLEEEAGNKAFCPGRRGRVS